ncbi:MAG: hypothetical protein K0R67_2412, partial [Paenibacillus sp.]|nr:hypothetical protein [Paenibacillus sp.]
EERGASNVLEGLKIELNPSKEEKADCREYGRKFAKLVLGDA